MSEKERIVDGLLSLYSDRFDPLRGWLPLTIVEIVSFLIIPKLNLKPVHNLGARVGRSPCDLFVKTDDYGGCTLQCDPVHIVIRRMELHFVPDRGQCHVQVHVVG